MAKALVFLSHISEEIELAQLLQDRLRKAFLGMIDIFVAGDIGSVALGDEWLARITEALRTCDVMLVLCSEASVIRPWINFEVGSGWTRDILVIPICHTDMRKNALPLPLSLRQGINANQPNDLRDLYQQIAVVLGSDPPEANFADIAAKVTEFEREYGYMRHVRENLHQIVATVPQLETLFTPGTTVTKFDGTIDQRLFDQIAAHLDWLQRQGLLVFELGASSGLQFAGPATGIFLSFKLAVLDAYYETAPAVVGRAGS